jgi:hypothetical protein
VWKEEWVSHFFQFATSLLDNSSADVDSYKVGALGADVSTYYSAMFHLYIENLAVLLNKNK